jgi:Ala-tRNA(Pro) deacylase
VKISIPDIEEAIMSISRTLEDRLRSRGSQYEVLQHPHSFNSMSTAEVAHIPGDRLAKTIVLEDESGYAAAVLPSTHHLRLSDLWKSTGRRLVLATESEVRELFKDCETGAVPPVTMAYGMPTYLDESLAQQPDIYFEAGDHEALIHMRTEQFLDLMENTTRVRCAYRM